MKHYKTTNLLKGSLTPATIVLLILAFSMSACTGTNGTTDTCPLVGKWAITNLQTTQSSRLDASAQEIYQQEVDKMLDSARLAIHPDSTYQLHMGPDREQGRWKWDSKDSLLRLEQSAGKKTYYIVHKNGNQSFKLKKDLDSQGLELTLKNLPH